MSENNVQDNSELDSIKNNIEQIKDFIKNKLNDQFPEISQKLSDALKEKAEEICSQIVSIVPYGDYDRYTDEPKDILNFIKNDACQPDNWLLDAVSIEESGLLKVEFSNKSVDDGDGSLVRGFVFMNNGGVIRHFFVQKD